MKRKSRCRLEQDLFDAIDRSFQDGITKERTLYLLQWYTNRAEFYRRQTYRATFFSIFIPAVIALLNSGIIASEAARIPTVVLSFLSSIGAGLYAFLHSKEHWLRYRVTAEMLKQKTICYLAAEKSTAVSSVDREFAFLNEIENIAAAEVDKWHSMRQSNEIQKKDSSKAQQEASKE